MAWADNPKAMVRARTKRLFNPLADPRNRIKPRASSVRQTGRATLLTSHPEHDRTFLSLENMVELLHGQWILATSRSAGAVGSLTVG